MLQNRNLQGPGEKAWIAEIEFGGPIINLLTVAVTAEARQPISQHDFFRMYTQVIG
jgi:hypothetical protein